MAYKSSDTVGNKQQQPGQKQDFNKNRGGSTTDKTGGGTGQKSY